MTHYFSLDPEHLAHARSLRENGIKVPTPEEDTKVFDKFVESNPHLKDSSPAYTGEERRKRRNEFFSGPERRKSILGAKESP